ncbi:MAG: AAA family ATPase [bacterium]|nr:AAA family ATPase [bacterium]
MPKETERRFLVTRPSKGFLNKKFPQIEIEQGYFELLSPVKSFRVRISNNSSARNASLTIKSGKGMVRDENELKRVPLKFGQLMMDISHHRLFKTRRLVYKWEVDSYGGPLSGIVLAEQENPPAGNLILPKIIGDGIEVTDILTNLHLARLSTDLGNSGENPLSHILKIAIPIKKIALVGGPGSGKSGLMKYLKVVRPGLQMVPETATTIMERLEISPGDSIPDKRRFQQLIYRTQSIFEITSAQIASQEGKTALVFDRGTVDGAVYLDDGIMEFEGLMCTKLRDEYQRYDLVIALETPPEEVYNKNCKNNPNRYEKNYQQALETGSRTISCWGWHPNFKFIANGRSWEDKVSRALKTIDNFV